MAARGRGQAAIELTVALMAVIILFTGAVKIWAWMVETIVTRQEGYEQSRQPAADHRTAGMINPDTGRFDALDPRTGALTNRSPQPCLSIFGEDTSADCR